MKESRNWRILFIGNSYTYYNNLPGLLEYFVKTSHIGSLKTKRVVHGGANLKTHWDNRKALKAIRSGKYTHVVLQEQSRLGGTYKDGILRVGSPNIFFDYARRFDKEIKKSGAETVFFLTWALDGIPKNQIKLNLAYSTISKKVHGVLVPVGPVWRMVRKQRPDIQLYEADQAHPSPIGTYLITCIFYSVLFKKKPIGLPARTYQSTSEKSSSHPKIIRLTKKDARFLQVIAWKMAR